MRNNYRHAPKDGSHDDNYTAGVKAYSDGRYKEAIAYLGKAKAQGNPKADKALIHAKAASNPQWGKERWTEHANELTRALETPKR